MVVIIVPITVLMVMIFLSVTGMVMRAILSMLVVLMVVMMTTFNVLNHNAAVLIDYHNLIVILRTAITSILMFILMLVMLMVLILHFYFSGAMIMRTPTLLAEVMKLVEEGDPNEIDDEPEHRYQDDLVGIDEGCVNDSFDGFLEYVEGDEDQEERVYEAGYCLKTMIAKRMMRTGGELSAYPKGYLSLGGFVDM